MSRNFSVVHLNVRLERGGAAMVARHLHASLLREGHRSHVLYGYGPKAGRSPLERETAHSRQLMSRPRTLGNLLVHKTIGIDVLRPSHASRKAISTLLNDTDLVHLHAIHSHFLPYRWFLAELRRSAKPIVWTMHDSWAVTGRCAIPGTCTRWDAGCGTCPSHRAYPSAFLDLTGREAVGKRKAIRSLEGQLLMVSCSRWMADRVSRAFPHVQLEVITNGVDPEFELAADRMEPKSISDHGRAHLLVVGADLSDPVKQDLKMLAQLAERNDVTISLVGSHPPSLRRSIQVHGHVRDRTRLAELYSDADALLFTSRVDNFPLSVAEALRTGTPALCLDSPGTREVLSMVAATPYTTPKQLMQAVSERDWFRGYAASSEARLRAAAKVAYSSERMFRRYMDVYAERT
jgi:putative colanic acid biosynthesis glycosyltransferase